MVQEEYLDAYITSTTGLKRPAKPLFTYDSSDPLVIRVQFAPGNVWAWSRDLVAEAVVTEDHHSVGEGDVTLQTDGEWIRIRQITPGESGDDITVIRMIKQDLIDFVQKTVEIVGPDEAETKIVQSELDDFLTMILTEAKES